MSQPPTSQKYRLETLAIHAGANPDPSTGSCSIPVHRTSAYQFRNTEHAANLFALKELGNIYTRLMNPTTALLEERCAALEGGAAALGVASGTTAIHYSIINICKAGDEIVSANDLYGGTMTMFHDIHPQFNIGTTFVDPQNPENFAKAITPKTRAIFVETCGNPALNVPDFAAIADIANAHNLPLVVDNTFATPALCRPIEHGATVVCDSLTKWMGGHGAGIGGVVVDSGKFNWKDPKFALYNEPDGSYHGLRYAHDLGGLSPLAFILRMRLVPLRNLGACISPDNSWMFMQGMETLSLRMERHCSNTAAVAKHLKSHPLVKWVKWPGFEDHPTHANAKKYLGGQYGGMVVFGISGGVEAGRRFIESLKMFRHVANVGDAKSLAIHPATTTHSQLDAESQLRGGITPELIRLSIGLEHIDDILEDVDQALHAAAGGVAV
ncbi:MAG: O-acetylhomoserine aminocarboxypropyltransferase/cysteine synthase family protein [Candidatus Sumerlaeia bacterium]|nr:O-acetylhomoserine aminocarboxypropyltransferase/cysteine synthase family protein [Candidatus Sumerlaeia bacterium]